MALAAQALPGARRSRGAAPADRSALPMRPMSRRPVPRRFALLLSAGLAGMLALSGCGDAVPEERARLCRLTLPALNDEGTIISLRATAPAASGAGIRIDYTVAAAEGGPARSRYVICRFAQDIPGRAPAIASLVTDEGPVSGASLYLMKRFWLDTPDAAAADPARGPDGS